jgi:glucose-fructose oxidoreductase
MSSKRWKIAGINFDHMHMGDLLRMAQVHPNADIVGVCHTDRARMEPDIAALDIPEESIFTHYRLLMERTKPDIVILCPATAKHADWVEFIAPFGAHIHVEKPFATSRAEARRMIAACAKANVKLLINWPSRWVACHAMAKRLIDDGAIGQVFEVHHYGGNRGPLWHVADKAETTAEFVEAEKPRSWWYKKEAGGGSLLDYLGYGVTMSSWYLNGAEPIELTCTVDEPKGLEVDEHSITVARYAFGLSKYETRWGTYTDPWTHQPQPKCGYTLVGTEGTLTTYDYEPTVRVQSRAHPEGIDIPAEPLTPPYENSIQYFIHCLDTNAPIEGPVSPDISLLGQRMIDTAVQSAKEKRTITLLE